MPIRWMSETDAYTFLAAQTEGRLATCDAVGQPYITPLNYLYRDEKIYFHCKLTGRKLDNLVENHRVCFEVSEVKNFAISNDRPCACSTRYNSVLAFGVARLVSDESEKMTLLNLLTEKFAAGKPYKPVIEKEAARCAIVEICIEKISGKKNVDPE